MGGVKDSALMSAESLADELGVTPEELEQLEFDVQEMSSNDGLIYCYNIIFDKNNPRDLLDKMPDLDENLTISVSPNAFDSYPYDYDDQFDAVSGNSDPFGSFSVEMESLRRLIEAPVDSYVQPVLFRQTYISVIGLMETYLSDTFINVTMGNEIFFKNFVRTHPEFKKRKFQLCQIFDATNNLSDTAKAVMLDTIYHRLPDIREMYRDTFEMTFPGIDEMIGYVRDRHDLVHRNGKRKDGSTLVVDKVVLIELMDTTTVFIEGVQEGVNMALIDEVF